MRSHSAGNPGVFIVLSCALAASSVWGLFSGPADFRAADLAAAFRSLFEGGGGTVSLVFFAIRLPRVLLAAVIGASLGIAGAAFQGIFRNPLADPFIIGASSGASLGAGLAISLGISLVPPFSPVPLFAFGGSLSAVILAFAVSRAAGDPPPAAALLLAGTSIGSFFSSVLSLILVLRDRSLYQVYYWLLGSLGGSTWRELLSALPASAAGCALVCFCSGALDLLIQGDEEAGSLGLDVTKTRFIAASGASLAAASAVAAAGIIGFAGLIAPHCARLFTGPRHSRLIPASALTGALILVLADTTARTLIPPVEIPLGIITGLGGAPFFLYLLARHGRFPGRLS
ncbi:MAG: iron ABC transporter permease [Treponema sp.]|jgi:iron complex transport system permease protein|nr:iron ABC transporter permease [Treponema sp.]